MAVVDRKETVERRDRHRRAPQDLARSCLCSSGINEWPCAVPRIHLFPHSAQCLRCCLLSAVAGGSSRRKEHWFHGWFADGDSLVVCSSCCGGDTVDRTTVGMARRT